MKQKPKKPIIVEGLKILNPKDKKVNEEIYEKLTKLGYKPTKFCWNDPKPSE